MWIGKICLQGYLRLVFESILHSGAPGYSKVYASRTLARACKALFSRVRIPPCAKSVSPVDWICPSGRKNGTLNCVQERFILRFVIIRQRQMRLGASFGAMQRRALPGSGYRVLPIDAKRSLSAPNRKHLSFQPLLLHE